MLYISDVNKNKQHQNFLGMELSGMNSKQRLAFVIAVKSTESYIEGWKSIMADPELGPKDHKEAEEALSYPHGKLVEIILSECKAGCLWKRFRIVHTVGLNFLRDAISCRLTEYGC